MRKLVVVTFAVAMSVCLFAPAAAAVRKLEDPLAPLRAFFESKGWALLQVLSGHYSLGTVLMPENQAIRFRAQNCFPSLSQRRGLSRPAALESISQGDTYEVHVGLALLKQLF